MRHRTAPPPAGTWRRDHPGHAPPDWRTMTRHDFNADAGPPTLFELEPDQVAADDGHGTGDMLELLA